jgi:tetratricopeptide (TPR) repeat protein
MGVEERLSALRMNLKCRVERVPLAALLVGIATWGGAARGAAPQLPQKAEVAQQQAVAEKESKPSGDLGALESQLRARIAEHPDSPEDVYKLALVLRQENKPRDSLTTYTLAARLRRPDAMELRSVALDYVILDDYDDAIHWLQVAASADQNNTDVLYSLGRCYYTQSRFRDAEAVFLKLLSLTPGHRKAHEYLGLTYDAENAPEKAEASLKEAVKETGEQGVQDEWPALDLGVFFIDAGRAEDAVPVLREAARIAPNSAACHEKLGHALAESGKGGEAVQELELAVRLDPSNPKIHFALANAYRAAGFAEKARTEFTLTQTLYGQKNRN